jgi:rhodanese-related sulfurtransferase
MSQNRLGLAVFLVLVLGAAACSRGSEGESSISAAGLAERIEAGTAPLILDVRTPEEYSAGHIPGSLNIPHDQLSGRLAELGVPASAEIVVHCQSGRRAGIAEGVLADTGYTRVRDLNGHMAGWRDAGLPTQ